MQKHLPVSISCLMCVTTSPSHVMARRCGGGCGAAQQSCLPATTTSRLVPVLVSRCSLAPGRCHKQVSQLHMQIHCMPPQCALAEVWEATSCQCGCLASQQDACTNSTHTFYPHSCSCGCRVAREEEECKAAGRVWDTFTCTCTCTLHPLPQCSTGNTGYS